MKTKSALASFVLYVCSPFAFAAPLPVGALLTIDPGVVDFPQQSDNTLLSGSGLYVVDGYNGQINSVAFESGSDGGIIIGKNQSPAPVMDDAASIGEINDSYSFDGLTWFTDWTPDGTLNIFDDGSGVGTVVTTISSWDISGNGYTHISSASDTGNWVDLHVDQWQVIGDHYLLDFSAGIARTIYGDWGGYDQHVVDMVHWHYEGSIVQPVPVPAAAWLFGSGLVVLLGMSKRHRVCRA